MDDDAHARGLFRILTRPLDPDEPVDAYGTGRDGIDRYGGFGTEVRVTSVEVVPGPYGAQVDVGFVRDVPPDVAMADRGSVSLPVAREWREAQGFTTPELHAPEVASAVERAAGLLVERHVHPPRREPVLPDRAEQAALLRALEAQHPGTTFLVTPDEWEEVLRRHHGHGDSVAEDVDELVASGSPDDRFLVFWEGDLARSVRPELPPVHGTLRELLAMRASGPPPPGAAWFAYEPLGDDQLPG